MLNTELYGEPNPETVKRARAEVWAQIGEKQLSTGAAMMARELEEIYGFAKPDSRAQRLPDLGSSAALDWAGEQMLAANSDIEALVNDFWLHKVAENGTDYVCEPHDIQKIFEQVIALRDPENTMQLRAILEEGATALSWDSSRMAVIIGSKRTPIQNVDELTKKYFTNLVYMDSERSMVQKQASYHLRPVCLQIPYSQIILRTRKASLFCLKRQLVANRLNGMLVILRIH